MINCVEAEGGVIAQGLQIEESMETNPLSKNPTQIIRDDHKRLIGLFRQSETVRARTPEMQSALFQEIFEEIEIHSRIEEEVFYPQLILAADEAGDASLRGWMDQGVENHRWIDQAVRDLKGRNVEAVSFSAQFAELRERFESHLFEEEQEVLPQAEILLGNQREDLAEKMRSFRETGAPGIPGVQAPHGGEQRRSIG